MVLAAVQAERVHFAKVQQKQVQLLLKGQRRNGVAEVWVKNVLFLDLLLLLLMV